MTSRTAFPLFQTPIDLAHGYWMALIKKGDCVIDATCGNGHDTAFLAATLESAGGGSLTAIDLQQAAIDEAAKRCSNWLLPSSAVQLTFLKHCHSTFPAHISPASAALIVYNLGYLPGGDKSVTTLTSSTLQSLQAALHLLKEGGVLSITCYPGHEEGKKEERLIIEFCETLQPERWSCCHHRWTNRRNAPSLLLIQKGQVR